MFKFKHIEKTGPKIKTHLTTENLDSLKTGLDVARQSYKEELDRFYSLEKKTEYPLKFFSVSLTILAFLGITGLDSLKSLEGKQAEIVYTSVFLILLLTLIGLVFYVLVTRVWRIKKERIGKEQFHGIINQGNDRLMRILIYEYSSNELGLRKTNRKKAMFLAGLNYCMIAYLCILLLTPLVLVLFS